MTRVCGLSYGWDSLAFLAPPYFPITPEASVQDRFFSHTLQLCSWLGVPQGEDEGGGQHVTRNKTTGTAWESILERGQQPPVTTPHPPRQSVLGYCSNFIIPESS